jgi:hypothetical protein
VRDTEEQAITRLTESLVAAFASVPESQVRDCVLRIHAKFDQARIRTYVPVLVESQARSALKNQSAVPWPRAGEPRPTPAQV